MKTIKTTKGVSVERVTPPALLGFTKCAGKSERVESESFTLEFDKEKKNRWRTELFVRYARHLLEKSDKIYADERLFYSEVPLPISCWSKNGSLYEGQRVTPTLGHIIYWWQNYRCSQVEDKDGRHHFIYGFAFSPMRKFCQSEREDVDKVLYVGDDDHGHRVAVDRSLFEIGTSLNEVCSRYGNHPPTRSCFELEDAIALLLGEEIYHRLE